MQLLTSWSILYCHESLHLKEQRLHTAWLPEFEKRESDEESDEGEGDESRPRPLKDYYMQGKMERVHCTTH